MANNKKFAVKNGLLTQNVDFVSPNETNTISVSMLDSDTLSVSGNSGQLFSITDSQTGTIFAVNDISGVPSIEVFDTGKIQLAETFGNVLIGTATDAGHKLQVNGTVSAYGYIGSGQGLTNLNASSLASGTVASARLGSGTANSTTWLRGDGTWTTNVGYAGSQGYTGSQGIQGVIGYTGSQGIQGVIGYTGSKGDQGVIGYTGSQGIQGVIGYTGSQGIIGYTGSQGIQGVIGYTGSKGDQGVIGYTGSAGPSNIINATNDTTTTALYPVLVAATGSNQTAKANTANLSFNAVTGTLRTGNLLIDGDFTVGGTTVTLNTSTLSIADNMMYLNAPSTATITNASGSGTAVTYTAANDFQAGMSIVVTGVTPSQYNIALSDAKTITSATSTQFVVASTATGTYTSGGTASARVSANPDIGFAAGYYDTSYAHTGVFRDATDGVYKFFKGYAPEPDASVFIDTAHASFAFADVQTGNLKSVNLSITGYGQVINSSGQWVGPNSGLIGYTGSQGIQGVIGYTGSQGVIGYTGSQGIQGIIGYTGSKGDQGVIGYTGSQGIIGYTGSQGIQGVIGYTGSQGIIGYTGSQGIQGVIGYTGSQGIIGYTGSQGIQGVIGYTGSKGDQGVIGYSGSQGPSTAINATNDTTTTLLYPVFVGAAGSNQTPKVTTTKLTWNASTGGLTISGPLQATSKSFLIEHPTKPGKKLLHGSLEGPEHGVYVRGKVKGSAIELPEYWTELVDVDSITVQLTAIGKGQKLYVEDIRNNKVYIANNGMFAGEPHCFYLIQAERVDIEKLVEEVD